MEFKVGDKYKQEYNCIGEKIDTISTIMSPMNERGLIRVVNKRIIYRNGEKIKTVFELMLTPEFLENRINLGYMEKIN